MDIDLKGLESKSPEEQHEIYLLVLAENERLAAEYEAARGEQNATTE
jgi:hypothetical protein